MKKRSLSIETPQKPWRPLLKKPQRQRAWITRQLIRNIAVFILVFAVSCSILLFQHIRASSFFMMINPIGKSPAFEKSLQSSLSQAHLDVQTETITNDGSVMVKLAQNNTVVYFSPKKSAASQVSSLQAIATQLTIDGRRAYQIDFRFDVPVVSSESL